jgi:hypothetical protein
MVSTDSSAPFLSKDNPNWHIFHDVPVTRSEGDESEEDSIQVPPTPKRTRRNYELTRKFQIDWSAKAPWSEMILTREGFLHMVKCSICTAMRGHPIIMGPKWDTVQRHGKRVCHVKNTEFYAQRRPTTVLEQIQGCNTLESRKKVSTNCVNGSFVLFVSGLASWSDLLWVQLSDVITFVVVVLL